MRRPTRFAVGTVVVVLGLVGLAACSADEPVPDPTTSASDGETAAPDASTDSWTRAEIEAALFDAPTTPDPLATVSGELPNSAGTNPATIEVTAVVATDTSTLVQFTLKNVDDSDPTLHGEAFNADAPGTLDIRGITLIDAEQQLRLQPYVGRPVNDADVGDPLCACSNAPLNMSPTGQLLTAVFPPVSAAAETVTLELLGFPLLENLPVSRAAR